MDSNTNKEYQRMNIYRRIYEQHYGPIPKDEEGRSYEIHHIDGNRSNNDINNLKCVSIQEHYDIHYSQKDWGACLLLSKRMKLSVKEKSELAKYNVQQQLYNGRHPWQTEKYKKSQSIKMSSEQNPFFGGKIQSESNQKRLKDQTHHLLGTNSNKKMLEKGLHPSQKKWKCEYCNKEGTGSTNYIRWHGNNCKHK